MSRKKTKQYVTKASNETTSVSHLRMSEMGTIALSQIRNDSEKMKAIELKWPNFLATVECMKEDATVATALDTTYTFVEKSFKEFKVLHSDNEASKKAADFIEFCFKNMDSQTLRQFARSAATFNEYGFSVFEKLYTVVTTGEYAGMMKIKKLAFRPQASLARNNPFVYGKDARELVGIKQSVSAFVNASAFGILNGVDFPPEMITPNTTVTIPIEKVLLMSFGGTESNPAGVSPLVGCYRAFREKILIENLEVVGATKDLGGVIELKLPSQILNKAAQDPSSHEAEMVKGLMQDAANAHSGEQAFFMLPSDVNDKGSEQYKMTLKGIDGAGKQYNTQDLINSRKKSILDRFACGFMNLGNEQAGSYNLSESKQTIHSHYVQRVNEIIIEALNENVIPQVLALNGIRLSHADMPKLKSGLISEVDMEEFSKFVQRTGAVGYLPKTPGVINKILEVGGFDERVDEDISQEELLKLLGDPTSRSGDGMAAGTSGNGTSKLSSTRDNSAANLEN